MKMLVRSDVYISNPGFLGRTLNKLQRRRRERYAAKVKEALKSRESVADDLTIAFVSDNYLTGLFSNLPDLDIDLVGMIRVHRKLRHPDPKTHMIAALQTATGEFQCHGTSGRYDNRVRERELLDQVLFWTATDLERKLLRFQAYNNQERIHASLDGTTPDAKQAIDRSR